MENIKFPIYLTTLYLIIYTLSPYLGFGDGIILLMFVFAPFLVIWMVIRILKDGKESQRKFEDYWYDDIDITRSN